jgi:Domain of unknown function (DUF5666)
MSDPNSPELINPEEPEMNPSSPQQLAAEPYDEYDDGFDDDLPVRPRANYLTPLTALLMALILGGVGFYVGIRVEKSKTSSGTGAASAFTRAFSGGTAATAGTGSTGKTGSSSRTGATGAGSFASRFAAGGLGGAAGGTVGSVSSVSGNTIYVNETSGNTVKVKLSSATKISKSESVTRKKLYPGDAVVVAGSASSNGTVHATSVTDSGASSTGASSTGGSSTSGSSSTSNSTSAIGSLFGGG